jgi:hypothetical protein
MHDDLNIGYLLFVGLLLLAPALVVFIIVTVLRVRRAKFHRHRGTTHKSDRK